MKLASVSSLLIFIAFSILSCKKSDEGTPKDYAAVIKDKNWWGVFAYTGKTEEYYSVAFKTGNILTWSQRSGDTPGQWVLDGNTITMTFSGNTMEIKATITNDNKFVNIRDNTTASEITSGQIITTPSVYLDNTTWKGSIPASSQALQLSFMTMQKVTIGSGSGTPFGPYTYDRVASGSSVRFTSAAYGGNVFGIMISDKEMKGSMGVGATNYQWLATLQ